ncbi:MAG: DUF1127 domain-containing protein [Pseudomonas sp.]
MNGLSDVRLTLHEQELAQGGRGSALRVVQPVEALPGQSRWTAFWRRLHTRKALLDLDDAQLRDIGLSREQARAEALRPFWRL